MFVRGEHPTGASTLSNLGLRLDARSRRGRRWLPPEPGPHGLDMFLHLSGEETQVTGAQLSRRAHECPVDYASVMLRSASGILGTVEVGNGFPRDGTDGEWKIAGRDAILTMKDGIMKLATAEGDETFPGADITAPAFTASVFTAVRDALDHWRRGAAPPISVQDCARVVRLIDQAYECAAAE
jgi:predicted dehydrogenase